MHAARLTLFAALFAAGVACVATPANAAWTPANLHSSSATLEDVLRRMTDAAGAPRAGFERRRERWTYAVGMAHLPVEVAVRDDDFRVTVLAGSARYRAGRRSGMPWRADANGIAHGTFGDLQGDAIDRLPHALFPFAVTDCSLAGVTAGSAPAWAIAYRPAGDRPRWFFVDQGSGHVIREVTREGKREISIRYESFVRVDGIVRPMRWRVSDGDRANAFTATADAVEPGAVTADDIAPPLGTEVFTAADEAMPLHARFSGKRIEVNAIVAGRGAHLLLDSGTQSIMLDRDFLARAGYPTLLEHAVVSSIRVGPLTAKDVSVLSVPLGFDGILGYDFFVGHVVHIDYREERVEVLSRLAAEPLFADPHALVVRADYSEGLPLVHGRIDEAEGDRFALDIGSPHLYLFAPLLARYAMQTARWTLSTFPWTRSQYETVSYLEGSVEMEAHSVTGLDLGKLRLTGLIVGVELTNRRSDAIEIPFDAIVGTDALQSLEIWFDADGRRVAFRR